MSISPTSKVSRSSPATTRSSFSNRNKDQVDGVDTTNNVFVRPGMEENDNRDSSDRKDHHQNQKQTNISMLNQNHIPQITEAIGSDETLLEINEDNGHKHNHVSIYTNNQTIIQNEKNQSQKYAKHFYETNEIIEEIDEFA